MNTYATPADLQSNLGYAIDADRALVLLDEASRAVDNFCQRHFFTMPDVRYFDSSGPRTDIDDVLSVSEVLADEGMDESYTLEWVEGTDFELYPDNTWPKMYIRRKRLANVWASDSSRYFKVTGVFGYGDGRSGDPWEIDGTATVANTTATQVTLSGSERIQAGNTIKVGAEQMFVRSVTGNDATVERGVNGTAASAHTAAGAYVALYPAAVSRFARVLASRAVNMESKSGFRSESIGNYNYTLSPDQGIATGGTASIYQDFYRAVGYYRREIV